MERALAELRRRSPGNPGPLVYAVVQQAMAGRDEAARAALTDYIFRFGGSAENLMLAATPLAEMAVRPLLEQCVAAARERGFPLPPFQGLLLETHLRRGEWEAAALILAALPPPAEKDAAEKIRREWLRRLLDAVRSEVEPPRRELVEFLSGRPWAMVVYRGSVEALVRAGQLETAREVLDLAQQAYPASQGLKATAAEVKLQLMARTPAQPATVGGGGARSAAAVAFEQRLEQLLRARDWSEAGAAHRQSSESLSRAALAGTPGGSDSAGPGADCLWAGQHHRRRGGRAAISQRGSGAYPRTHGCRARVLCQRRQAGCGGDCTRGGGALAGLCLGAGGTAGVGTCGKDGDRTGAEDRRPAGKRTRSTGGRPCGLAGSRATCPACWPRRGSC